MADEKSIAGGKVPQCFIEPNADPVLAGSRPDDPPQNAYRGNREELDPGRATSTGNGGISQTAGHLQERWEQAAKDAKSSGSRSAGARDEDSAGATPRQNTSSTQPRNTRKTSD